MLLGHRLALFAILPTHQKYIDGTKKINNNINKLEESQILFIFYYEEVYKVSNLYILFFFFSNYGDY